MEQLAECLKQKGEQIDTPANLWLNDLIHAYVSASLWNLKILKCGNYRVSLPNHPSDIGNH